MMTMNLPSQQAHERQTASIGMTLAIGSWALVFITLVWAYLFFRVRTGMWFGGMIDAKIIVTALANSLVLSLSSWLLHRGKVKAAVFAGLLFLAGQWMIWQWAYFHGLRWKHSMAGNFFYLLTVFHALHILGGLVALCVLSLRQTVDRHAPFATAVRVFWDFLLVVWAIMFVLIFIVK